MAKMEGPPVMVNACTGKMGNAVAEAVVRAGLQLVPFSFTGESEAVAIGNMGISGIPVELVPQATRQKAMEDVVQDYPGLIIVDYTLPQAVNDNASFYSSNQSALCHGHHWRRQRPAPG
ncbi:hypothetical protein WJX84_002189 [Apatococcus fuscideae]|uniref:Dihydrodipicolinate reductase N-terminal domain-containing protein n=1 Tax=Apatococcus fuscideae TaxID=2026836 RepID=A0AAW1T729_9CHLO